MRWRRRSRSAPGSRPGPGFSATASAAARPPRLTACWPPGSAWRQSTPYMTAHGGRWSRCTEPRSPGSPSPMPWPRSGTCRRRSTSATESCSDEHARGLAPDRLGRPDCVYAEPDARSRVSAQVFEVTATDSRTDLDELCVDTIRTLSMDAVQKANSGHPGTPMALAPLAYVLYTRILRHNPRDPDWPDRDRFVLSCGHASMLLYSTLYLAGYDITLEDIKQFRQLGSKTPGHPEREV